MTRLRRTLAGAALLGCLLCRAQADAETVFYVATGGNDTWSGSLPEPNATATDGPFASLGRARDAVRALKAERGLLGPVSVLVRGGVYPLTETLVLGPEDSGSEQCPVTYRAFPNEQATVTGGRPVGGWQRQDDGLWVADLAAQGFEDFRFRELFFKGERLTLARYPNLDPAHPVTGGLLYVGDTASRDRNCFHYEEGSIPFARWGEIPQAEVNIFPYNCWDHNIIRIVSVDTQSSLVTLRHSVAGSIYVGNRYFIQNVRQALDAPGEWFSDYAAGKLYLLPPDGAAPGEGDVAVPMLENIIEIAGTPEAPVQHVTIRGLHLQHARQDAIALEGAEHCAVLGNTITQVGGVGVNVGYLRNAVKGIGLPWRKAAAGRVSIHSGDRALVFGHLCSACRVAGNDVSSTGGDGIALGGSRNTADNNHLWLTGLYDRVCAALTICGDENTASHNAIHDVPRDGIFVNGGLNTAEYNDIRRSMLYTADNAAIALRQHDVHQAVKARGNVLRYNRLLDTIGYGSYPHCTHPGNGFASPFCSFGIYLDGSISGVTVYGNVIARCGGNSVFIQFGGDNTVENNILVEGDEKRIQFDSMIFFGTFTFPDAWEQYRDAEPPNRILRNILSYGGPDTKLYQVGHWDNPAEWNRRQAVFERNLVWHKGQPVTVSMHKTLACKSMEQWQAQGFDAGSVVADPMFVDAAQDDYRLRPDSPAYKLGFRDINAEIERIGAYESDERASWPLANTATFREEPVVFEFPERPISIVDGYELSPVGSPAAKAQTYAAAPAYALVSSDAAKTGRHSLQFTDAPGANNPWEPHVVYRPDYREGRLHLSLDLMNSTVAPADLYMEFRDWDAELLVGPTFRVTRDGQFIVNGRLGSDGQVIGEAPLGEWCNVTIDFELSQAGALQYDLKLSVPGKQDVVARLPFCDQAFEHLTWFGISSTTTERSVFYVDNLVLGLADDERVRSAQSAPSITGAGREEPAAMATTPTPDGLCAYWRFEGNGLELQDSSGNGVTGDLGGAQRATGPFGSALYLDGGGGVATLPDCPLLQFGIGDFSLDCWLYPVSLDVASEHKRRRVLGKEGYPATWWNVDLLADGRVQMEMADEAAYSGTTISEGTLPLRAWTHLVITVDRTSRKTSYYINGKLDSVRDLPPAFTGALDVPGRPLLTGAWQQYIGALSELRVYKRVLGADEVAGTYETARGRYAEGGLRVEQDE